MDEDDKPTSFLLNDLYLGASFKFEIRTYSDPTLQVCSKTTSDSIGIGSTGTTGTTGTTN